MKKAFLAMFAVFAVFVLAFFVCLVFSCKKDMIFEVKGLEKITVDKKTIVADLGDIRSLGQKESILSKLSLDQKIGQMLMIGFDGKEITPEIENLIKTIHPGAILLLKKNIGTEEQIKNLIISLQELAKTDSGLPLLIAVDQEGQALNRINVKDDISQSQIKNTGEAYNIGRNRGQMLLKLGINLNLAPMLDQVLTKDFIFERAFNKDAKTIKDLSESIVMGQKDAGLFSAIKHFPGYTGIHFNPEEKLARVDTAFDISQFPSEAKSEMIMVSNVVYKSIDEKLPFSFSKKGIDYLKENIKGNYVILSDDLDQNSLLNEFSIDDIMISPVNAGIDMLIFSGFRKPATEGFMAIQKAVAENKISEETINQRAGKIIELKEMIKL